MRKSAYLPALLWIIPLFLWSQPHCWQTFTQITDYRAILETEDALWMATGGGLLEFRLPGRQLGRHYTSANTSFPVSSVVALAAGPDGKIWVATPQDIGRIDETGINSLPAYMDGLAAAAGQRPQLSNLFISRDGRLWAGTQKHGLFEYNGKSWKQHTGSVEALSIGSILEDARGNIWIGTRFGLGKLSKGQLAFFPGQPLLYSRRMMDIALDDNGNIWAPNDALLLRFDEQKVTEHDIRAYYQEKLSKPITQLSRGKDGQLYALAEGNVYRLGPEGWRKAAWAYPIRPVEAFYVSQDGAIWGWGRQFGGLKIWENRHWSSPGLSGIYPVSSKMGSLLETEAGLLMAGGNYLMKYSNKALAPLEDPRLPYSGILTEYPPGRVLHTCYHYLGKQLVVQELSPGDGRVIRETALALEERPTLKNVQARGDTVIILSTNQVFLYLPEQNILRPYEPLRLPSGRAKALKWDGQETLWAWMESGIYRKDASGWTAFGENEHPFRSASSIRGFTMDADGRPWAIYSFHLYKYENGGWQQDIHLPVDRIFCHDPFRLVFGPQGNLWLGRRANLWKYDGQDWTSLAPQAIKQAGGWISALKPSRDGSKLWVCTDTGFFELETNCTPPPAERTGQPDPSSEEGGIDFTVSPNPFSRILNVELKRLAPGPFTLSIRNADGQVILERNYPGSQESVQLDFTQQQPAGVYFVSVVQKEKALTRQVVKGE